MNTGVTAVKSVLDKPLHDLTEDDISQLTREDCRRYLKEKGMRRPSWNKSQAIQQVICLKSLLEPTPTKPPIRAAQIPPTTTTTVTVASNSSSSVKELSPDDNDGSVSALAENGGLSQPAGLSGLDAAREGECPASSDAKATLVRRTGAPHMPNGQMTIFYSGMVNVYDGIPVDKARTIMHLASTPIQFCQDEPSSGNSAHWSTPCRFPTSSVKINVATQDVANVQSVITDVESQMNRQVSLQRYFEKRKDRGKFKMKRKIGSSSSGLEMYLNHQMRVPVTSGQITRSPSQLGTPGTVHGVMGKQLKNPGLSVDLNDKGIMELDQLNLDGIHPSTQKLTSHHHLPRHI